MYYKCLYDKQRSLTVCKKHVKGALSSNVKAYTNRNAFVRDMAYNYIYNRILIGTYNALLKGVMLNDL